jgi:hypothetical protein
MARTVAVMLSLGPTISAGVEDVNAEFIFSLVQAFVPSVVY